MAYSVFSVGLVFATGLIMVVVGGSELFTGNCLMPMAWADKKITTGAMLRNWVIVYLGNFVGSVLTAYFVFLGKQHTFGGGAVGVGCSEHRHRQDQSGIRPMCFSGHLL